MWPNVMRRRPEMRLYSRCVKVSGKTVAQRMGADTLVNSGCQRRPLEPLTYGTVVQVVSPQHAGAWTSADSGGRELDMMSH